MFVYKQKENKQYLPVNNNKGSHKDDEIAVVFTVLSDLAGEEH